MRNIPLDHLPLRPSTLERCKRSGFVTAAEIESSKADGGWATLAAELGLSTVQEAHAVYQEIRSSIGCTGNKENTTTTTLDASSSSSTTKGSKSTTVAEALRSSSAKTTGSRTIITFCRDLDGLLGGGIPLGEVTEIAGSPGAGKTLMATQLAVDTALPAAFGGVGGGTVYIDTEGSFAPERCFSLAQALISHVQGSVHHRRKQSGMAVSASWNATPEDILNNIHVFRVHTVLELMTVLQALPEFLDQFQNSVRLVVVDSIAFPFRAEAAERYRNRQLVVAAAELATIATQYNVAAVTINQMTTNTAGNVVPALGASWAHAVTNRIVLDTTNDHCQRTAQLTKAARFPPGTAPFLVTEAGIRSDTSSSRKKQRS